MRHGTTGATSGAVKYPHRASIFTPIGARYDDVVPGLSIARVKTSPGYNSNRLPRHLLGVHLGDPVTVLHRRDGREEAHRFHPGDVVFTAAGSPIHYAHGSEVDALYISIDPSYVRDVADQGVIPPDHVALRDDFGATDIRLHRIGRDLFDEVADSRSGGRLYVETLAVQLVIHLLRCYGAGAGRREGARDVQNTDRARRLERAVEYINDRLADDLSLSDIAAVVHLTPHYFCRRFKEVYNISPHQYVIRRRVEKARVLLQRSRLTVGEIALRVGFSDHSHLNRHYKRHFGRPPRDDTAQR